MGDEFVPGWNFFVEIFRVGVRKGSETEIKIVDVKLVESKTEIFVRGLEECGVFEAVAQAKSAIMEEVVAEPGVAHAGLLGNGFESGMRVDHAHGDEKTVVRNSVEADASVVVGNILYEPVDRVVGVGGFVHALGIARLMNRTEHYEFSFGAVAPANVLEGEDVAVGDHVGVAEEHAGEAFIGAGNAVSSAIHENRERA